MTRRRPSQYVWRKLRFDERLLTRHFTVRPGRDVRFIVVHHMTIVGHGSGSALDACYTTWQTREASAHYGVDGLHVGQFVRQKDRAWATGNADGNEHGISIEHANETAGPTWRVNSTTWKRGARLAAYLHRAHGLGRPVANVTLRRHHDFTSTACPGPYIDSIWGDYVREAQRVYDEITGKKRPVRQRLVGTWYRVSVDTANVRNGPGTSHKVVGSAPRGRRFRVKRVVNGWAETWRSTKHRPRWVSTTVAERISR